MPITLNGISNWHHGGLGAIGVLAFEFCGYRILATPARPMLLALLLGV
jgi:hypothetical protein